MRTANCGLLTLSLARAPGRRLYTNAHATWSQCVRKQSPLRSSRVQALSPDEAFKEMGDRYSGHVVVGRDLDVY